MLTTKTKRKALIKRNVPLFFMVLPGVVLTIMFSYIPVFGVVLAFKDFSYRKGIWGSDWVGLENFKYIFGSSDIYTAVLNTILYNLVFAITVLLGGFIAALLLYYVKSKAIARIYQVGIQVPYLLSWTVIGAIVYIFLKGDGGVVNALLEKMGKEPIMFYIEPVYWPFILVFVNFWFGAGIKSIYFYSSLMGIDKCLFEAAEIDGAKWYHKIKSIIIPGIMPMICFQLIQLLGHIISSGHFALFHSVTRNSSVLYGVTDTIATYTYRGLTMGNIGTTTALGIFTSVVTLILTRIVNGIVKKYSPGNELY